jgi:two-component system chemotaxis response regulator CheB
LRAVLQRASALSVIEVEDKQPILGGGVYLAPADYHLLVECESFALSTDEPVLYARPSIDVLFESAADAYGAGVIGIILTGASADGARGLAAIKGQGGLAVVQDPASAECNIMPAAALGAVAADFVVPLLEIAPVLVKLSHVLQR